MTESASGRLRIAYVYRHFNDEGSLSSIFRDRAERLADVADVTVFTSSSTRSETDAPLRFENVEPAVIGHGRIVRAVECATFARRATRKLRSLREQFDVVHVDGYAAREADLVTVHAVRPAEVEHYFDEVEPKAVVRRRLTPLLRPQTGVVLSIERRLFRPPYPLCLTLSRRIAADLKRYHGVPDELVQVQPYGLDRELFRFDGDARRRERAAAGVGDERLVLLFVGDDFARKGLARAVEALAACGDTVELWVSGGGDPEPLRAQAGSLGVAGRVRFFGRVGREQVAALLSAADVLVLPSLQDAWGHPVIEAMGVGLPVVVSAFAGAHEAVEPGESGFVIDGVGGGAEIAALVNGPLADAAVRRKMGARGVEASRAFDQDDVFARFLQAHHRAAELRRARLRAAA